MTISDPVLVAIIIVFIPNVIPVARRRSPLLGIIIAVQIQLVATGVLLGTSSNLAFLALLPVSSLLIDLAQEALVRQSQSHRYGLDLLATLLRLTVAILIAGHPSIVTGFGPMIVRAVRFVQQQNSVAATVSREDLHAVLISAVGIVLAGFQANHLVTSVLKGLSLLPEDAGTDAGTNARTDSEQTEAGPNERNHEVAPTKEAARGRIIGIIERSLIFLLTVHGMMSAITFIVAAKAFARFKDLDKRSFAEYVLIGTLLSIGSAIAIGLVFIDV